MTRKKAREVALHLLYALSCNPENSAEELLSSLPDWQDEYPLLGQSPGAEADYIADLADGVQANGAAFEEKIAKHAAHWRVERITRLSLILMKMALYEMQNVEGVTAAVAINEAVELCKRYDGGEAASFINGILGSIVREAASS